MNVYIAGKISDKPKDVYELQFLQAAGMIRGYGYHPINPVEITSHLEEGTPWKEYMTICLAAVLDADAIWLLPDWEDSRGARIEEMIARERGIVRFEQKEIEQQLFNPGMASVDQMTASMNC